MKKTIMMVLAGLLSVAALADDVKFKVSNMHCDNCARRVEKALKGNEAVGEVTVNLEDRTVCVSYDAQKTTVAVLRQCLADARFQAEVARQCDKKEECAGQAAGHHKCRKEKGAVQAGQEGGQEGGQESCCGEKAADQQ